MELIRFVRILSPIFPPEFIDITISYMRHHINHFAGKMNKYIDNSYTEVNEIETCNSWAEWENYWGVRYNRGTVVYWVTQEFTSVIPTTNIKIEHYIDIQIRVDSIDYRQSIDSHSIKVDPDKDEPRIFKWLYDRDTIPFRLQLQTALH